MDKKTVGLIAILCLVVGMVGMVATVILPQNLNILLLALLAIALFLENHKVLMDAFYGKTFGTALKVIRIIILAALVLGFAFYIILSAIGGAVITPLFMAILSIGLFLSNRIFNQGKPKADG